MKVDAESEFSKAMKTGSTKVQGEERVIKTAARKTAAGKKNQEITEADRIQGDMLLAASLRKRNVFQDDDDDSDWESAEEDAPAVRLEELLDNMKIDDGTEDQEIDFDAEGQPGNKNQEEAKKHD